MSSPINETQAPLLIKDSGIRRIYVERLFGQYTYDLSDKGLGPGMSPKLVLLYGDNGSGKTTILRILFFLLSHVDREGHKTKVSRITFKQFVVDFADGTTVLAYRQDQHAAPYELKVSKDGKVVAQASYGGEKRNVSELPPQEAVRWLEDSAKRDLEHAKVLQTLKELNLGTIYLTDDRAVLTTIPGVIERKRRILTRTPSREAFEERSSTALATAVDQISSWAARRAFRGSAQGEEDVNSAYAAIMKRLAYAPQYVTQSSDLQAVIDALKEQSRRSPDFVRFGLIKPLKVDEIIDYLRSADSQVRGTMLAVLEPYVAGVKARLDALEPVRSQLSAFADTMNSFYRNKTVHLDVDHGLKITGMKGDILAPSVLSSGEGQLLYLLASTVVAKEQSHLFMIDEPEISLNVKWQRQLLASLLDLTADSNIQFVLATHSIELLTRYSQFVRELSDEPQ